MSRLRLALVVCALVACDRSPASTTDHGASTTSAAPVSSAPAAAPVTAPASARASATTSSSASSIASDPAVQARLAAFFAQYKDGSDFAFLRAACVSPIERFVTARNADIGAVIASARRFFKDKRALAYRPDFKGLRLERQGDLTVARLPLTMSWGERPPADWSPSYSPAVPDAGELDPLYAGLVQHDTTVDVELAYDAAGRITRYLEGAPHQALLRFHAEEHCLMTDDAPGVPVIAVANNETVTDLGERYVTQLTPKGPQVIRHVRLRGGGDAWVNDARAWAVAAPGGGTSAGGVDCLVPVTPPAATTVR